MLDAIKTYLAPASGVVASFIVGWGAQHGYNLDAQQVASLVVATFVLVERIVAAFSNPTNAATPTALRASRVMLAQHGEPSMGTAFRSGASKAGPVRKDD